MDSHVKSEIEYILESNKNLKCKTLNNNHLYIGYWNICKLMKLNWKLALR